MVGGFIVKGHRVGARFAKVIDILLGLHDHQMTIEGQRGEPAQIGDDLGPPGDIGHESAVHRVEVQQIGTGGFDQRDLVGDRGEVGGQQRRRDLDGRLDRIIDVQRSLFRLSRRAR
jgi:hypothetical protein